MQFIETVQSEREKMMNDIYLNAYIRELEAATKGEQKKPSNIAKIVFYGVKMVNTSPKPTDKEGAENQFEGISALKGIISLLTLQEFINIFPIEKKYDGNKYGMKDYYSTLGAIKELDLQPHEPLGEHTLNFLMEYMNRNILLFNVKAMTVLNAIRRFDGHLNLFEEFMASQGMDTDNTFKNSKGEAMYVRHGKPVKIKMNKQQHGGLQLVK